MEKNYKEYLKDIRCFIFDVDGVMTDGRVLITTDGQLYRAMNIKDGFALKTAVDKGYEVVAISGGNNTGVKSRLEGLGLSEIYLGVSDKISLMYEIFSRKEIETNQVLYMGDDIPDLHAMQEVILPCCPQDAVPEIKAVSRYVSHRSGGQGCVRDVIEQVLKVQGNWAVNGPTSAKYD
ncbi:KdsC family phosphatase [Aureitalea marina]|uniref:3-deoxy-D-manno-octulosonate 8-phosphate phosphatase n=1 Tax=Aureitalea marina TaxID=930804 RepID=A0A2S7KPH5_9FLAO|nr:3-deoxy-D-manno-octulosonate 8-phosphate phosphatase [Aureitalea marina]PQB04521.1 3-deoxy-D-manno-octulosonate 8-phosphate phosphatase [Aureitalea marina]